MKNRFNIFPEINFSISVLHPGMQTFEEIYQVAKMFREDKDFSKVYYQLTDIRGCIFNFKLTRMPEFLTMIESYKSLDNQKIGVYLVDSPKETAYLDLFFSSFNQNREYCYTVQKAYTLLGVPLLFEDFQKLINEMVNTIA